MNNLTNSFKKEQLRQVLDKLFGKVDDALFKFVLPLIEWKELDGNKYLFHQGDTTNCLYILMSGRMQAIIRSADLSEKVVGEISRGETIGEMALFTDHPRSAGIKAVRDSHLVCISREAFNQIANRYPTVNSNITKLIINRLKKNNAGEKSNQKVCNIVLLPISKNVPLVELTKQLEGKMKPFGKVFNLSSKSIDQLLNDDTVSSASSDSNLYHRFSDWLDKREHENDYMLFQADSSPTPWTKRCLRQADEIILVANANESPTLSETEITLLQTENKLSSATQKLLLLHSDNNISGTRHWLANRNVKSYHHLRHQINNDLEKFARFMTGNATGLVLSGGGAKGLSHVGVFKALKENNIPIDFVGGTSFGSIVGALIAMDISPEEVYDIAKNIFMSNPTPKKDYNFLPIISLLSGRKIDQILLDTVSDLKIEDLPISFFCVSANLTKAKMVVHQSGKVGRAVRASISLPGIFPPVILENELHVDGAMFNNLPIDVMESMGVGNTIAIDLNNPTEKTVELEKMPSSWQYLSSKILKKKRYRIPNIMSTMMQSSMINSSQKTRKSRSRADLYVNPNLSKFGFMEWKKFDQIVDIGYKDTTKVLENWKGFTYK